MQSGAGVVRHFQDSKDKASMANLKHHATCCFGEDAVNATMTGKQASKHNGLIFALFACKGKQPLKYLHRVHTNPEVWSVTSNFIYFSTVLTYNNSTHLIKWITENNQPANIIND